MNTWCEILIGGDDISNDVITLAPFFYSLCTFALVSVHCRKFDSSVDRKPQGNNLEVEIFKFQRHSCKLDFPFSPCRQSTLESLLTEIVSISQHNDWADLATERERQLTTACANQTTGLTNSTAANWAPEVDFSPHRASNDVPVLLLNQPSILLNISTTSLSISELFISFPGGGGTP